MAALDNINDDDINPASAQLSRTVLQVLWRRKLLVVIGAAAGLALAGLLYTQQQAVFQSSAQILVIKKSREPVLPLSGSNPGAVYVEDYVSTHLVVLRSPVLIDRAVKKRDLGKLKSFEERGDPVALIAAGLVVSRDNSKDTSSGPSNIVNMSFRGPVSEDCPRVLQALIETYQELLDYYYVNTTELTLNLISQAREALRKDKVEAEAKHKAFLKDSPLLWRTKDGSNIFQDRIARVEEKRSELMVRKAELEGKLAAIQSALDRKEERVALAVALANINDQRSAAPKEQSPEEMLLPLLLEEQQWLVEYGYGPDNAKVRAVRQKIATVKEFLQKRQGKAEPNRRRGQEQQTIALNPVERYLYTLHHDLQTVSALNKELGTMSQKLKDEARELVNLELEEAQLKNHIDQLDELHKVTVKRLTEINLLKDAGGFDAKVLSNPGPGAQVAPRMMMFLLAGLFAGVLAGVGLAYLADYADRGFRSSEEVRLRLGLPLVGHIPALQPDAAAALRVAGGEAVLDPMLVAHYKSMSVEAESYRAVRTALYFGTQGEGHQVVQVTSPSKGDGKSLLIANLAVSIAQSNKKVVLVDADCRRPRQHKIFGIKAPAGLASVIAGDVDLQTALQPSRIANLDLLPAGPVPPNPAELLTSPRFPELLDALRGRYDFVLVDTPPLLAVTDPCVVAARVDGLFLVIKLSRDARPKAERAREILGSLGVKVFGVIVNGVTRRGGAGLYAAERYDYTESYQETDDEDDGGDGYYQADEEK
jgi:capsular exopolysaccharide synthesis family protein